MKQKLIILCMCFLCYYLPVIAQVKTVTEDKDWAEQQAFLNNTIEAEYIIRIGDIDNLGFGWPDDFDPFCGRMTQAHFYPWPANETDLPGFDRILLSSRFKPNTDHKCGGDGYSEAFNAATSMPVTYNLPTNSLQGVSINNAYLQLFIDDFQAPTFCSRFQVMLNGIRFAEAEKIINGIDQTGPVGKLITIPIPEEFYTAINTKPELRFKIDEVTGAADGFGIDFIRLLVNRKRDNTCKGSINGQVLDKQTQQPIAGALISVADQVGVKTDAAGRFSLKNIPTGYEIVGASATGYNDGSSAADIGQGNDNPELIIYLQKGKKVIFDQQSVQVGETIQLKNILFDQGKAIIKNESKPELDKLVNFMRANQAAEIELSGHTSSEGEAGFNRSLSYQRVKACKDYIVQKGIDAGRIIAKGFGPDRPVASNDTEAGRIKNRRVEMRLMKL